MSISLTKVASKLRLSPQELKRRSLEAYFQQELRQIQAEILRICNQYDVTGEDGMLARYQSGELPEEGTWEDFFRLDHLEARRKELENLLQSLP